MTTEEPSAPTGPRRMSTLWIVLIIVGVVVAVSVGVGALFVIGMIRHQTHAARETRIRLEQDELQTGLQAYRLQYGNFPPAENSLSALQAHVRRNFPRYGGDLEADLSRLGLDVADLDASEALVFWLGGLRKTPDSTELIGFGRDPGNPFDRDSANGFPSFEFDQLRLVDTDADNWLEYVTFDRDGEEVSFHLLEQGKVGVTGVELPELP